MRRGSSTLRLAVLIATALGATIPAKAISRAESRPPAHAPATAKAPAPSDADASALYNDGTEALARGDLGAAVGFLAAAHRIEPRASDLRGNLAIARARAAEMLGDAPGRERPSPPSPLALSTAEAWWLAAVLVAMGALVGVATAFRRAPRRVALSGLAALVLGLILWAGMFLRAREEARHPEAVVVVPLLSVGPAPYERPRPPYLLGAGEEVRLGRTRGELVEIRVGGNSIGWAQRSGLWRVADAPRYTSNSRSR